ncbi:hypothetical protein QUF72_13780 [Desulfobacterales bacterium HSG2]|nr:hypothetical protein [Desulfobacterales bacterium HSG2]
METHDGKPFPSRRRIWQSAGSMMGSRRRIWQSGGSMMETVPEPPDLAIRREHDGNRSQAAGFGNPAGA